MIEKTQRSKPNISLTPLIDVVFILLIFFMIIMQFNKYQQLPISVTNQSLEVQSLLSSNYSEPLQLLLQENGKCRVNSFSSECTVLIEELNAKYITMVVLNFDEKATLDSILKVYQLLLDKGVNIQLSTSVTSVKRNALADKSMNINRIASQSALNDDINLSEKTSGRDDVRE